MKNKLILLLIILLSPSCMLAPPVSMTFSNRRGNTFAVRINNESTKPIGEVPIIDINGAEANKVNWEYKTSQKKLCFNASALSEEYGEFVNIQIVIHEINNNSSFYNWKSYMISPHTVDPYTGEAVWVPNQDFCPEYYFLTPRLKYPTLPKGEYIFEISYLGRMNWDRQTILLRIE